MHRNKVGPATAQPNNKTNIQAPSIKTMWKSGRVQSGMSMEDLKHQTALRLANEQRDDPTANADETPAATNEGRQPHFQTAPVPPPQQQLNSPPPYRSPLNFTRSAPQPQQYGNYQQRFDQQQQPYDTRNYSDTQLGLASAGSQPLFNNNPGGRNSYSTPRNHRNAPLQDRGSAENRSFDDTSSSVNEAASSGGGSGNKQVASPIKGRVGSNSSLKSHSSLKKKGSNASGNQKKDGRVTPVKDHIEPQRILYSTPNGRREISTSTPSSVYSEPQSRAHNKSTARSPRPSTASNMHSMTRSPEYKSGRSSASSATPSNTPFYKNNPSQQQSKLPHGLTVQELKEMTRARLAAEANYEGDSVHSGGTAGENGSGQPPDRNGSPDQYPLPPPLPPPQAGSNYVQFRKGSADGISISSGASNGNLNGYVQAHQGPPLPSIGGHLGPTPSQATHPHHGRMQPPPALAPPPAGPPMQYPYPRHPSPVYQQKPRTDTWDNSSAASEQYQVPDLYSQNTGGPSFSPQTGMTFNRGRCFSAGATTSTGLMGPSYEANSWEEAPRHRQQQPDMYRPPNMGMFYEPTEEANRRRCATMSPPGMSRLHEDRPFLFSGDEKEKLAIPPLSEPRPRFNSTGILGSAFEPIASCFSGGACATGMHPGLPPSPPSLVERVKFNMEDRTISTGSNGDLPSSVAEAVLESLTASTGPMDLFNSPFRPSDEVVGSKSPFRKAPSNEYPLENMVETSGSGSLFSSGPSQKSVFSSEYTNNNDRLLSATYSWGGELGEDNSSSFGFSQEFNNLLNIANDAPGPRGRAQTAPCFGENHNFRSLLDPELEETGNNDMYELSSPMMLGFGRSTNLPPGFDKPSGSS